MIKICPLKLEAVINRGFKDHRSDNATSTCLIGSIGDTQIQVISTNEKAFLIEDEQGHNLALTESKEGDSLLERLIDSLYKTVDSNESLCLDDVRDRDVLKVSLVEAITKELVRTP